MTYYRDLMTLMCIDLVAVLGAFTLTGLTGLVSFGQGGFMAIAAYTSVLTHMNLGLPWPIAVILGMCVSCLVSAAVGYPSLRLTGDFFGLATFGFGEAVAALFRMLTQVTGGTRGLGGIPRYTTLWIALAAALAAGFLVTNLKNSRYGRTSLAIRSDELAASVLGMDIHRHRMKILLFSTALASLGGGLLAFFIYYMDPLIFNWTTSVDQLIVVYFGGVNSLTGCIVSTFILKALPEALQVLAQYRLIIYSVMVILTLIIRPQGLLGDHELTLATIRACTLKLVKRIRRPSPANLENHQT